MSAAYSIWGMAIDVYNWRKNLAWMPLVVRVILLNCMIQSCPLASAVAHCAFQLSFLSMVTPRNLAVSFEGMRWLPRINALRGVGIFFLGLTGLGTSFVVMSGSWNFSMPNLQLCKVAHSKTPPARFMMLRILL